MEQISLPSPLAEDMRVFSKATDVFDFMQATSWCATVGEASAEAPEPPPEPQEPPPHTPEPPQVIARNGLEEKAQAMLQFCERKRFPVMDKKLFLLLRDLYLLP